MFSVEMFLRIDRLFWPDSVSGLARYLDEI